MLVLGGARAGDTESGSLDPREDTVFVTAQEAWQTDDGAAFHARGALSVRSGGWRIDAQQAVIDGPLEDPDRITVSGRPARITVDRGSDEAPFEGTSRRLEFEPRRERVRLEGEARVSRGRQSIASDAIDYLLARDTFAAGGPGRVRVVTTPE